MSVRNIILIASGAALAAAIAIAAIAARKPAPTDISSKLHLIKEETVCLRFKVIANPDSELLLAGKFFDLDGNVVGRFEKPFSSNGPIGVTFADIDLDGHHVVFPQALIIGDSEMSLTEFYTHGGFPQVYSSTLLDSTLKAGIGCIFGMLVSGRDDDIAKAYGKVSTTTNQTDLPSEGASYEWHVTSGGQIFFLKN